MISLTFFVGSAGRTFFNKVFLVYVHLSYNYYEIGSCSKVLLIVYDLEYCLSYIVKFY